MRLRGTDSQSNLPPSAVLTPGGENRRLVDGFDAVAIIDATSFLINHVYATFLTRHLWAHVNVGEASASVATVRLALPLTSGPTGVVFLFAKSAVDGQIAFAKWASGRGLH